MTNSLRRIITESHTGALVNPPLLVFMTLFCYSRYSLFTLCIQTMKTHQHLSIVYSVLIRFWSGETFSTKDGVFAVLIPSRFFCHCSLSERKIIVCVLEAEYCPKINMSGRVMVNRAHANFKRKIKVLNSHIYLNQDFLSHLSPRCVLCKYLQVIEAE